jgi:hypothetical protein
MRSIITNKLVLPISIFLISLLLMGCDDVAPGGVLAAQTGVQVDERFIDFYARLGGADVVGPAISPMFSYGTVSYQYTLTCLMAYDSQLQGPRQYYLAGTGADMGLDQPSVQPPNDADLRYVDGHVIPQMFIKLYDQLGARLVGSPLTEARYNPELQRYEQYFNNVGFFSRNGNGQDDVFLLAYGSWKCGDTCIGLDVGSAIVKVPEQVDERFAKSVSRLGPALTGFAVSESYTTPDGYVEQIFENVVLMVNPKQPGRVFLRPVTVALGMEPEPLVTANQHKGMTFVPIQGGKGYNVSQAFLDYLAQHGGNDAAGPPIGEYNLLRENVYRQCFVNLCLEEYPDVGEPLRIRPSPLGRSYLSLPRQPLEQAKPASEKAVSTPIVLPTELPAPAQTDPPRGQVSLETWVRHPVISPGASQELYVLVLDQKVAVRDVEPDLTILLPDGSHKLLYMLPTGKDGESRYQLDGLDVPAGSVIKYEVCVYYPRGETTCVQGSYLVGQGP